MSLSSPFWASFRAHRAYTSGLREKGRDCQPTSRSLRSCATTARLCDSFDCRTGSARPAICTRSWLGGTLPGCSRASVWPGRVACVWWTVGWVLTLVFLIRSTSVGRLRLGAPGLAPYANMWSVNMSLVAELLSATGRKDSPEITALAEPCLGQSSPYII